ncbi:MFS transporter [Rhodococcus sp. 1168]|uniref:MFS transporter n=1 Tax=Rhodococcus sp. 1168 TaxID=2018041 RepID=UPI000B5AF803|nr:MFS transporter [Rhodococcus sp. 1168]
MKSGVLGRDFVLFSAARMVTVIGSAVTAVAFPILMYQLTGSAAWTSLVAAFHVAPYLLFGLVAGAVADRQSRRRIMVVANVVAASALLTVPVAGNAGALHVGHILAVAGSVSSAFVWFDAAAFGALLTLVGREQVARANSVMWTATTLLGVVGPALGGLLVACTGASISVALDAVCYLVAAICLIVVARPMGPARRPGHEATASRGLGAAIGEGVRFILGHSAIRSLTLVGVANSVAAGGLTGLLLVFAVERLGFNARGSGYGALLGLIAAGGFFAAAILPTLSQRLPVGRITMAGLAVCVPSILVLSTTTSGIGACVCLLIYSGGNTVVILNGINLRQQLTPDHLQARVNTTARMAAWGGTPFGAIACGLLTKVVDARIALAATTIVLAFGLAYGHQAGLSRRDFGTS